MIGLFYKPYFTVHPIVADPRTLAGSTQENPVPADNEERDILQLCSVQQLNHHRPDHGIIRLSRERVP
ncbi:hypothetical protein SAMN02799630_04679 [Paenibacillus sp. UNCCL117]|nr:hypothetical protein SAMN04488602_11816 [Paenibacillus sp. cl123]SFW59376.1 hypothetical protein SAMN02799630_04679 [Paenibacillus sp. UNCCL117]